MSEIWRFLWPAALLMAFSLHGLALDAYGQSDCITATSPNTMTVIFPEESLAEGDTVRECAADFGACAKTYWEWRDKYQIPMKRRT